MSSNLIREHLANIHDDLLLMDGLDDAIIGTSQRINEPVLAVYSWEKIIENLSSGVRDYKDLMSLNIPNLKVKTLDRIFNSLDSTLKYKSDLL